MFSMLGSVQSYFDGLWNNQILMVFVIVVIGYMVGRIRIGGIELGTAAVLLIAIVFGHFGLKVPAIVQNMGLVLFVTSVGFIAGPKFFRNFKKNAISYILLGLIIIVTGAATCIGIKYAAGIPTDLALGLMVGSLTSTPGLSAAIEATGGALSAAATGYGIAYPFGVISVVLFVQLVPKIFKTDMKAERENLAGVSSDFKETELKKFNFDPMGYCSFGLAVIIGLLLSSIRIPLGGGAEFSLGTTGGPLIAALILGHFGHIGPVNITIKKSVLEPLRELGLILFLVGAGVSAGNGFVNIIKEYGFLLFVYGMPMALLPMFMGYLFARKVFKLGTFNSLGAITGGMTSTPALGTLIEVTGTDDVASAYAATYPIALVAVVLCSQFIGMIP